MLSRMPPTDLERVVEQYGHARVSESLSKALTQVSAAHAAGAAPSSWTPSQRALLRPLLEGRNGGRSDFAPSAPPKAQPPPPSTLNRQLNFPRLEGLESLRAAGVPLSTFLPAWLNEEEGDAAGPQDAPTARSDVTASTGTQSLPPQMPGFIVRGMQKQ